MVPVGVAADRVYRPPMLPWGAVSSYLAFPPLPRRNGAVYLCCTIPEVTLGGRYPLSLPCAARTFLIPEGTRPSAPVTVSIITQKTDGRKFFSCYFGLRWIKSRLSAQASASTAGKVSQTPVTPSSALSANSTGGIAMMLRTTDGRKFFSCYFGLRWIKSRLSAQASASTAGKVSQTPVTPSSALSANSTGGIAMMLRTSEMIKPREACPAALK